VKTLKPRHFNPVLLEFEPFTNQDSDMVAVEQTDTVNRNKVEIYSSMFCMFSIMAVRLLDSKAIAYSRHKVDFAPKLRAEMRTRSGRTSVPQIFIGDTHIGGCDELYALEDSGQLDALLNN